MGELRDGLPFGADTIVLPFVVRVEGVTVAPGVGRTVAQMARLDGVRPEAERVGGTDDRRV